MMPRPGLDAAMMGPSNGQCVFFIVLMALPLLAGTLWALRRGASTRPGLTGALAGFWRAARRRWSIRSTAPRTARCSTPPGTCSRSSARPARRRPRSAGAALVARAGFRRAAPHHRLSGESPRPEPVADAISRVPAPQHPEPGGHHPARGGRGARDPRGLRGAAAGAARARRRASAVRAGGGGAPAGDADPLSRRGAADRGRRRRQLRADRARPRGAWPSIRRASIPPI